MTKLAQYFDDLDVFHGMDYADIELLSGYFQIIPTKANHPLFLEGEAGDALFIILEGHVQVYKMLEDKKHPIALENPGKILGEMALLDGENRSASCTFLDNGSVATITRDSFHKLEIEHPAVALRFVKLVVKLVSRRLRMTTGKLSQFLT